jgi:hypothetical protein
VTLRKAPVREEATLPGGDTVTIEVGVPQDPYIRRRELDTVDVELRIEGRVVAAINTVLDADQAKQARELAQEIKSGLESGELEPTAQAIEPLADRLR